uniref:Uncharacterized protein n=1 Tax=Rhizophora mucronata TaxID=61149 RepID=A0A2P2QS42_RHIMU
MYFIVYMPDSVDVLDRLEISLLLSFSKYFCVPSMYMKISVGKCNSSGNIFPVLEICIYFQFFHFVYATVIFVSTLMFFSDCN